MVLAQMEGIITKQRLMCGLSLLSVFVMAASPYLKHYAFCALMPFRVGSRHLLQRVKATPREVCTGR